MLNLFHPKSCSWTAGKTAIRQMFRREFGTASTMCIPEIIREAGNVAVFEWKDPSELRVCGFFTVEDERIKVQRGCWDKLSFIQKRGLYRSMIVSALRVGILIRGNGSFSIRKPT